MTGAVANTDLRDGPKCESLNTLHAHSKGHDLRQDPSTELPRQPPVGDHERKGPVGRTQQPLGNREALVLVGVEQRLTRTSRHDERELPRQVVRVLQTGVHALRTYRTVDVCGIAEQEAAAVAEAHSSPMMDAVGGVPAACLEGQPASRFL